MKKCIYLGLFLVVFAFIGCCGPINEGVLSEGVVLAYGDDFVYNHDYVKILNKDGYIKVFEAVNISKYGEELKKSKEEKIPVDIEIRTDYAFAGCMGNSWERIKSVKFIK